MSHPEDAAARGGDWHPIGMGKRLIRPLQAAALLALTLSLGAAAWPGRPGRLLGNALIVLLVAAPLSRVVFFVGRWWQIGDRRFAIVAAALLLEIGLGATIALQ